MSAPERTYPAAKILYTGRPLRPNEVELASLLVQAGLSEVGAIGVFNAEKNGEKEQKRNEQQRAYRQRVKEAKR